MLKEDEYRDHLQAKLPDWLEHLRVGQPAQQQVGGPVRTAEDRIRAVAELQVAMDIKAGIVAAGEQEVANFFAIEQTRRLYYAEYRRLSRYSIWQDLTVAPIGGNGFVTASLAAVLRIHAHDSIPDLRCLPKWFAWRKGDNEPLNKRGMRLDEALLLLAEMSGVEGER